MSETIEDTDIADSRLLGGTESGEAFLPPEYHPIVFHFREELLAFFGERLSGFERKFDQVLRFMGRSPTLQIGKINSDLDHTLSMLCHAFLFLRNAHIRELFSDEEILRMLHTIVLHDIGEMANGDIPIDEKEQMTFEQKVALDAQEHDYVLRFIHESTCTSELKDRLKGYFETYCRHKNGGDLASVLVKLLDMYDALLTILQKGDNASRLAQECVERIRKHQKLVFSEDPKYTQLLSFFDRAITNAEGVLSARTGQGIRYYRLPYGAMEDPISGEEKPIISWRIACLGWLFCTVNLNTESVIDETQLWQWNILAGLTPINHPQSPPVDKLNE